MPLCNIATGHAALDGAPLWPAGHLPREGGDGVSSLRAWLQAAPWYFASRASIALTLPAERPAGSNVAAR